MSYHHIIRRCRPWLAPFYRIRYDCNHKIRSIAFSVESDYLTNYLTNNEYVIVYSTSGGLYPCFAAMNLQLHSIIRYRQPTQNRKLTMAPTRLILRRSPPGCVHRVTPHLYERRPSTSSTRVCPVNRSYSYPSPAAGNVAAIPSSRWAALRIETCCGNAGLDQ
jgi:hypothetical protein